MMCRITGGPAAAEAYRSSHSLKDQELIVSLWGVRGVSCILSGLVSGIYKLHFTRKIYFLHCIKYS